MAGEKLFCFGLGYSGLTLARALRDRGWAVAGTCRSAAKADALRAEGIGAVVLAPGLCFEPVLLDGATHLLSTVPPDATAHDAASGGDPVLAALAAPLARLAPTVRWAGYLSTTGVYGDQGGGWVDEDAPLAPRSERARARVAAETAWAALGLPLHVFRLPGIYGPGRSAIDQVRAGTARRIDKPGQVFSRIHVADIAAAVMASMARPRPGAVYNVADDHPCPSPEVIAYAASLLGVAVPPLIPFDQASLSPMAASFYAENKRVSNRRLKEELGLTLLYPTYRDGLAAQMAGSAGE